VVLVGGLSWWWTEIDTNPVVVIPPPPAAPVPNGFDTCYTACKALSTAGSPAEKAVYKPNDAKVFATVKLSDAVALIDKNAGPIQTLRKSFSQDYQEPHERSIMALFPWYSRYRAMARFLAFAAHTRAVQGNQVAALRLALDDMAFGQPLQHDTLFIGGLVGYSCQSIGRDQAWNVLSALDGPTARAGAQRLTAMIAANPTDIASTLTEEKYMGQSVLMEMFHTPRTRWGAFLEMPDGPAALTASLTINKRETMKLYTAYLDAQIIQAQLPRKKRGPTPPLPNNVMVRFFCPVFDRAVLKADMALCENRLLLVALAVRAHRAEHAAYPASLAKLVPTYLDSIPDDPFGTGPVRYKRTGSSYVLYSVGPNGTDDGGTPATGKSITDSSSGDVVAGVNRR
jgi:hypothetical protein